MGWEQKANFALMGAVSVALVGALLFIPSSVCACLTPAMQFQRMFGVDPTRADVAATRAALMKKFPVGTPAEDVGMDCKELNRIAPKQAPICIKDAGAIRCHFGMTSSAFGILGGGMRFEISFDDGDHVRDVTVERTTLFFGAEL